MELDEPLSIELPDPLPNRQVVDQGHGERSQLRPVTAELPDDRGTIRPPSKSQHPVGGLPDGGLLPVRRRTQEKVVVLATPGVHAHPVDPVLQN